MARFKTIVIVSDRSVMTILCSPITISDFHIFDKNVICVKGGIVDNALGYSELLS